MPSILILLLDAAVIAGGIELTSWIIGTFLFPGLDVGFKGVTVSAVAGLGVGVATSYLTGLHQHSLLVRHKEVALRSLLVGAGTALGVLLASHFVWYQAMGRTALVLVAITTSVGLFAWRSVYAGFIRRGPRVKVIVLGTGPRERLLATALSRVRHARYDVTGLLGADAADELDGVPVLGPIQEAVPICRGRGVDTVVVVSSSGLASERQEALSKLRVNGFEIKTAEATMMSLLRQVPVDMVDDRWLLHLFEQLEQSRDRAKRVLDIGIAGVGLAVFGALLPLLFVLVKTTSRGPFFFVQERVGLGNRPFGVVKVRTMQMAPRGTEADAQRWASQGDARTTAVGRFLRRTRLDELPQFWNVLRGEMSVVGPRPEQPKIAAQLEQQISYFSYRHLVKPGITGWAQIHFGYAGTVEESRVKLAYDLYYVRHHTLLLDIDIMLRTLFVMLARIGSR